jgi:hypothetical protein
MAKKLPVKAVNAFAEKVKRRARMIIESPRTIEGRNVKRVASGALAKSLRHKISGRALEFSSATHGYWVENGRKPSAKMPPIEAFITWVRLKRIKPRDARGRFVSPTPSRIRSIAFLAARKVKEKGYQGIQFYEKAIQRELANPNNDLRKAAREMTEDETRKRIKITIKGQGRVS